MATKEELERLRSEMATKEELKSLEERLGKVEKGWTKSTPS